MIARNSKPTPKLSEMFSAADITPEYGELRVGKDSWQIKYDFRALATYQRETARCGGEENMGAMELMGVWAYALTDSARRRAGVIMHLEDFLGQLPVEDPQAFNGMMEPVLAEILRVNGESTGQGNAEGPVEG